MKGKYFVKLVWLWRWSLSFWPARPWRRNHRIGVGGAHSGGPGLLRPLRFQRPDRGGKRSPPRRQLGKQIEIVRGDDHASPNWPPTGDQDGFRRLKEVMGQ
jgi:hypothetical protein